jgi:hypothetical protein
MIPDETRQVAVHDFPLSSFPIRIEAVHPVTQEVLWMKTVQAPSDGTRDGILIPSFPAEFGHAVRIRILFGDGTVAEGG